jgi:hypothetical protein
MSFREKSAWAMGAVMLLTGAFYLFIVANMPPGVPAIAQIGPLIPYTIAVVVLSIIVQIVLAVKSPKEAEASADEREKIVIDRAGHWSGFVLALVAIHGALQYLWYGEGNILFQWVIGALIVSQIAEYGFQIYLFRKGA